MMASKNNQLYLYKSFLDAFTKANAGITKYACHYNAQMEWKKIKHSEELIKSNIEKYLGMSKNTEKNENNVKPSSIAHIEENNDKSKENQRKRRLSSDDEFEPFDSRLDVNYVTPVEPTFTKRDSEQTTEFNDLNKPWVFRSYERARARVEARLAKIEAKRLASANRIKTPAQETVLQELKDISERIASLVQVKNMGLSTPDSNLTLKKLLQQKRERAAVLSGLQSKQRAATRYRQRKKRCIESLCAADPEVAAELLRLYKPTTLRVQIENDCPDLLETLEEIARIGGALEINPRLVNVKPIASLDELRGKIKERGFEIRRSANFYRLIPSGAFTEDGKRHVNSTPTRLRKLRDVELVKHEDCHFVSATMQFAKDLAGTFGNDCVFYLVQDRKASVRMGRPIARGRAPLLMHLDYQVSTVDATPIPPSVPHQFKPVVYASCMIDDLGILTNIGPTYISIRSAKHDRFTVESEDIDFDCVVKLKEFEKTARNHVGTIKPIIIMGVDTLEPTNYTRFTKTLASSINKFKKYNLDALFIISQAPGQAAFNIVERRLAKLSQNLTGLVLPYDYFGTHLNVSGLTVDAELEKINLRKTGEVVADVWSMDMIDRHPVVAEYIDPPESIDEILRLIDTQFTLDSIVDDVCDEEEDIPLPLRVKRTRIIPCPKTFMEDNTKTSCNIDEYWCATHVFQTQYTIQIVRCTKPECCGPWRSNYIQVFPHRFLPPPVPFHRSSHGVRVVDIESSIATTNPVSPYYGTLYQRIQFHGIVMRRTQNVLLPFDYYCPSVQSKLQSRTCSICKQYIPSPIRLRNHYRVHQMRYAANAAGCTKKDGELIDEPEPIDPSDIFVHQINPIQNPVTLFSETVDWLKQDFEEDVIVESKPKSTATIANAMIRKERQLQEAAAAALGMDLATAVKATAIESAAIISVDNALKSDDVDLSLDQVKIEDESLSIIDVRTATDTISDSIEQLVVNDDGVNSHHIHSDNSLDQYDDLSDLIDKI